jgi:prophage regulatory protein
MQLLRIHEVTKLTGLSRSSVYKQIKLRNFPSGVKITDRSTAWPSIEVETWIADRIEARPSISAHRNAMYDNHEDNPHE